MKKFLSLVLSLAMTLSLVTIGAGATEYKDLSDKGEIQYEEAVAVLNKLGIITGYEDGSFKPTGALTRGAAAKIIVSLMIGAEAASNLTVAAAPYKDVATTNTFAAVISYCKTAGYINGYTDGTFRPTASLTGYAFAKMLLGALGYDGTVEGFTGSGWTMNVAKLGNKAGLFNDFATAFKGNDGVTREGACLLALNTLKATEVEYVGNTVSVSGKDIDVSVGNNQYSYVYSNNTNINQNIKGGNHDAADGYTLEFGEEHFTDLKLVQTSVTDSFGCPANQWNYKSVKIGAYAKSADFTYTTTASGDTAADKVKDMGIKDYTLGGNDADATGFVNQVVNGKTVADGDRVNALTAIPALLGKGTVVKLYTSDSVANRITNIVVIQSQVMQIKKVNSDNVTLKAVESSGLNNGVVNAVNDDDSAYATLKGLKADDFVVVTPLWNGSSYDVDSAYVPQTVTGNISSVTLDNGNVNGVTVSGTTYKLSKNWTVEDGQGNLDTSSVSTTVQSTLYLDNYGFMIYAKDVTASSDYIIYDETYSNVVDGRIHYFAQGYDMSGNALSLDMGTVSTVNTGLYAGDLMKYTTQNAPDNADYTWATGAREHVFASSTVAAGSYSFNNVPFASDVKFIFLTGSGTLNAASGDVTGVTVKDGVQKVTTATNIAYTLNDAGTQIKVMVISGDSDVEVSQNIMYVSEVTGLTKDSSNKNVSVFTGYIDGTETKNLVANKIINNPGFFTYAETDGIYKVSAYNPSDTSANYVDASTSLNIQDIVSKNYITKLDGTDPLNAHEALDASNAQVIDLVTDDGVSYSSIKDLAEATATNLFQIAIQYNASTTSSRGQVSYIYILKNTATTATYYTVAPVSVTTETNGLTATVTTDKTLYTVGETVTATVTVAGTAAAGTKNISVAGTGVTATAVTLGTLTNATVNGTTGVTVTAAAATNGTFTYTYTMSATSLNPTVTIEA